MLFVTSSSLKKLVYIFIVRSQIQAYSCIPEQMFFSQLQSGGLNTNLLDKYTPHLFSNRSKVGCE